MDDHHHPVRLRHPLTATDAGDRVGARLRIHEKVAGAPGEAVGEITRVVPGTEVTWHARTELRFLKRVTESPEERAAP
ncbi:MAG TPA: hypothetical protein VF069_18615 [Streptosporangiaceae bacterium]